MTLAVLSSPNFTGADLSARLNAALQELRPARRFANLAGLLADATLAYGTGPRAVAAGDLVQLAEGGFAYRVAAAGATDHHLTTAGGVKLAVLPDAAGHVAVDAFGTDQAALKAAVAAAAALGRPCYIGRPLTVAYAAAAEVIRLADNAHLIFGPNGVVTMQTFGLPVFFHTSDSGGKVTLENPKFIYAGIATVGRPAISDTFYGMTTGTSQTYSPRDQFAMCFFRGTDLTIRGTYSVVAADMSSPTRLAPRGLTVLDGPNGTPARVRADDFYFDGTLWGIFASGFDLLRVGNIISRRWGQLDTTVYTWEAPGHVIYVPATTVAPGAHVVSTGDLFDTGEEVGTPYATGCNSFRFAASHQRITLGHLYSARSQGLMDLSGRQISLVSAYWDGSGSSQAKIAVGKVMRITDFPTTTGPLDVDLGRITLVMPPDYNDSVQMYGKRLRGHVTLRLPGTAMAAGPLLVGTMEDCDLDLTLDMAQTQAGTPIIARLDGASLRNRIRARTNSPQFASLRFVSNDKTLASGNSAELVDLRTGGRRSWGQGYCRSEVAATLVASNPSGASVSFAGAIPKGAFVQGVQSLVRTAPGTSLGLTGYQVGIAADPDLYGVRSGATLGSGTDDSNWTAQGGGYQTAAQNLVLTAVGGNFDGTGAIEVMLQYSLGVRNGDLV